MVKDAARNAVLGAVCEERLVQTARALVDIPSLAREAGAGDLQCNVRSKR